MILIGGQRQRLAFGEKMAKRVDAMYLHLLKNSDVSVVASQLKPL
jgi:hypothetical protein